MTKKFSVILPISGYVVVEVAADDEESAIVAALDSNLTADDIEGWEAHRHITQGNVCNAMQWSAEATEIAE